MRFFFFFRARARINPFPISHRSYRFMLFSVGDSSPPYFFQPFIVEFLLKYNRFLKLPISTNFIPYLFRISIRDGHTITDFYFFQRFEVIYQSASQQFPQFSRFLRLCREFDFICRVLLNSLVSRIAFF